jgi:hypothetical protein
VSARFLVWFAAAAVLHAQGDPPAPPSEEEQKQIVAEVRAHALAYEQSLPDFTCRRVTRHNADVKGLNQWKLLENYSELLTYVGHKEDYKLLAMNGKKSDSDRDRPAGAGSVGEFIAILGNIFDPKAEAQITWGNWESLRGHRVHVISCVLKSEKSQYTVGKGKGAVNAGIVGLIYADSETNSVLRMALAAADIPKKFPIQSVVTDWNFDYAKIGDKVYLLPLKADLHSKEDKSQVWNEVEFKDFRPAK